MPLDISALENIRDESFSIAKECECTYKCKRFIDLAVAIGNVLPEISVKYRCSPTVQNSWRPESKEDKTS